MMMSGRKGVISRHRRGLALAAIVPLMIAACSDTDDAVDDGEEAVDDATDEAAEAADDAVDEAAEAADNEAAEAEEEPEAVEDVSDDAAVADEAESCDIDDLPLHEPGVLTIATGDPVFPPWMINDDPSNGEGFESAVAYALAEEMGFTADQVAWERTTFDEGLTSTEKNYDFNMQQYTITAERDAVVDFSLPYYIPDKAVVALRDSPAASATSFADLGALTLGAKVGTTDLTYIEDVIGVEATVFDEQVEVVGALASGEIDAMVVTLPTAFFLTAVQVDNSVIVGVLPMRSDSDDAGIGLLFSEGNELVGCVDRAMQVLTDDGTLGTIADQWLQGGGEIPDITP